MAVFQNRQLSKNFHENLRLVLGLVGLIDANGIDVAQSIWSDIRAKTVKKCFFCVFCQSVKFFWELAILKNCDFEKLAILNFFLQEKKDLLHADGNQSKFVR